MEENPKCETGNHENPKGEHRQQPLWPRSQQLLTRHIADDKGNKNKHELLVLHQDKKSCTTKETINETKRKPMKWEKIFESNISEKKFSIQIYKELIKVNPQKNNPVKWWAEGMNDTFSNKTSRWLTYTWKDVQHHSSLRKHKSKPSPHTCQNV